jgi:hypothetical protein
MTESDLCRVKVEFGGTPTGLENYPFLTPCVEVKKANLYGVSTRAILGRFSNAAAVNELRFTNGLLGVSDRAVPSGLSAIRRLATIRASKNISPVKS